MLRHSSAISRLLFRQLRSSAAMNGTSGPACRASEALEWEVVKAVSELIHAQLNPAAQRSASLVNFMEPKEMRTHIPIALGVDDEGDGSVAGILRLCEAVIGGSVRTAHPFFQNQLFQAPDPYGLAASFLVDALNSNVHTYEICPVFQAVESEVLHRLGLYCGFERAEGTFTPGGSMANMYGVALARHRMDASLKQRGLYTARPMAIFTSDQCHYSVQKGAAFMGFGRDSVFEVKTDRNGAMIPSELERTVGEAEARGFAPLVVNATCGTTVLGGFDPLPAIRELCTGRGMWLHVDACLGGGLLLSRKHRGQLRGLEEADSVSWNWHKLPGAPLLCSAFITPHRGALAEAFGFGAEYLFKEKYYDPANDRGDLSVQCGRKADALKVWLMLKARGSRGMEKLIDAAMDSAETFAAKVRAHPHFRLVLAGPQATSVCFWVQTPSVEAEEEGSKAWKEALETVALRLKERLVKAGEAMVAYQPIASKGLPSFFRVTVACHPGLSEQEMDRLLQLMSTHSRDL